MEQQVTLSMVDILPALRLLVVLIEGLGAVNFINWLRGAAWRLFGVKVAGHSALALTLVVAIVLSVGTLFMEGQLTGASFAWEHVDKAVAIILVASKARYDMLKRQQEPPTEPDPPDEAASPMALPSDWEVPDDWSA